MTSILSDSGEGRRRTEKDGEGRNQHKPDPAEVSSHLRVRPGYLSSIQKWGRTPPTSCRVRKERRWEREEEKGSKRDTHRTHYRSCCPCRPSSKAGLRSSHSLHNSSRRLLRTSHGILDEWPTAIRCCSRRRRGGRRTHPT